jgi:hypothetical protein
MGCCGMALHNHLREWIDAGGDSNLDGVVNLTDFNNLAANFGRTNRFWRHGDFNYEAVVNLVDFNSLAANFGKSVPPDTDDWIQAAPA